MLAAATFAAYAGLWLAQRGLWTNGFDPADPFALPRIGVDVQRASADGQLVVALGVVVCALFAVLVIRGGRWRSRWGRRAALAIPAVVAVGLFLAPPTLSIDTYSYLSHGYLASTGGNPYVQPSASVAGTPYGALLGAAGWLPVHPQSPYGPLWTTLERAAVELSGDDVALGIRLIKLPDLAALFGTAALVSAFLAGTRPEQRLRGTLLFLANPLVLIEFAGDGHNDGVMVAFVVLALVACARRRPAPALVALALAVLVKPTPLVLVLPIATYLVARRWSWGRLGLEAAIGLVVAAALAVLLAAPYWVGVATFDGLRASGTPTESWSVSGWLTTLLADGLPGSGFGVQVALAAILAVASAASCVLATTLRGLVRACAAVSLVAFLLLPLEWPWYAALPVAILPLTPGAVEIAAAVVLALGSRLIAGIGDEANLGLVGVEAFTRQQALLGQTIPAALALLLLPAGWSRRRRGPVPAQAPSGGDSSRSTRSLT